MNDKLELKDIACYLPYKLKMYAPYGFRPNGKESTGVPRIVYLTGDLYADIENMTFQGEVFKPILRPMTALVKPLPDGTIPIVELAKIEGRIGHYTLSDPKFGAYGVRFDVENDDNENDFVVFAWDNVNGFGEHYRPSLRWSIVYNQNNLWQYLYQHHFDINDLIGRGLAIDINTISL